MQFSHLKSLDASYPGLEGAGGGRFPDPASYVGLVCVGSRPCSEGLSLGTPVFVPRQKLTCSLFMLAVQGCAPRSCMDRTVAASGAYMSSVRPC